MNESQLANELQRESNIDKIKLAVEKVRKQKKIENSGDDTEELDFENLTYTG